MSKSTFLVYLRLLRIQGAGATAAAAIIPALIMGQHDLFLLSIIVIVGVMCHIFTAVHNEYLDIKVDEKSKDLKEKPLVSGAIPKRYALYISIAVIFMAYALTLVFFFSIYPLIFLTIALFLGGLYNSVGKKVPEFGMILGASCMFFSLYGASTISIQFNNLVYLAAFAIFIHIMFNTTVDGGLKDVDHDFLAGAKTTATRLGVKVINKKIKVTKKFTVYAYGLKFIYIALVLLVGFQKQVNLWGSELYLTQLLCIFLLIGILFTLYRFWHPPDFNRPKLIRIFAVHELASYVVAPIVISPLFGLRNTLILIFLPIVWFFIVNVIVYGKPMQPDV